MRAIGHLLSALSVVAFAGDDGVIGSAPALGEVFARAVGGQHLLVGGATVGGVGVAIEAAALLTDEAVDGLFRCLSHCRRRC